MRRRNYQNFIVSVLIAAMVNMLLVVTQVWAVQQAPEDCRHASGMEQQCMMEHTNCNSRATVITAVAAYKSAGCCVDLCNNHCPTCVQIGSTMPGETATPLPAPGNIYNTHTIPSLAGIVPDLLTPPPK